MYVVVKNAEGAVTHTTRIAGNEFQMFLKSLDPKTDNIVLTLESDDPSTDLRWSYSPGVKAVETQAVVVAGDAVVARIVRREGPVEVTGTVEYSDVALAWIFVFDDNYRTRGGGTVKMPLGQVSILRHVES